MREKMPKYDIEAMRRAMEHCDVNIKVFETAIQKELNTKMEYQRIIRDLEFKEANPPKIEIINEIIKDSQED
jgi:hypothetical protein